MERFLRAVLGQVDPLGPPVLGLVDRGSSSRGGPLFLQQQYSYRPGLDNSYIINLPLQAFVESDHCYRTVNTTQAELDLSKGSLLTPVWQCSETLFISRDVTMYVCLRKPNRLLLYKPKWTSPIGFLFARRPLCRSQSIFPPRI